MDDARDYTAMSGPEMLPDGSAFITLPPNTFLATRYERDGEYLERFTAADEAEARRICEERAWTYEGVAVYTIPGDTPEAEVDELLDAMNAADREVKH